MENKSSTRTTEQILSDLKKLKEEYEKIVKPRDYAILESCNYIVEIDANGQTISTDNEGKVIIVNVNYPMQFTLETAEKICTNLKVTNSKNEKIKLVMYDKIEWYQKRINTISKTINILGEL
jgi:hypothetical protein